MEDPNPVMGITWITIIVMLEAICLSMKTALQDFHEGDLKKLGNNNKKAVLLRKVLQNQKNEIYVLEFMQALLFVMVGMVYVKYIVPGLLSTEINVIGRAEQGIHTLCAFLLTLLVILFVTLFGIVMPKRLALRYGEEITLSMAGIILFLGWVLKPVSLCLNLSFKFILRLVGISPAQLEENVTEEEIILMVNEGHEQGVFDSNEVEMISNIIELDQKEAKDIMTNKRKIVAIQNDMTILEALQYMIKENYSRYPLYEDNRDNIIGILHLKDVIRTYISLEYKELTLKDLAREAYFVPDTQNVNILFHEMQYKNIHMAIVIDEYGQTAGLVAMEDFLEEIVGNIQDEYDEEEKLILHREVNDSIVKGSISLEKLAEELDIVLVHEDFDTLNGLMIFLLDRIPVDGETATLSYGGYQFDVLETKNKMIERVRITKEEEDGKITEIKDQESEEDKKSR